MPHSVLILFNLCESDAEIQNPRSYWMKFSLVHLVFAIILCEITSVACMYITSSLVLFISSNKLKEFSYNALLALILTTILAFSQAGKRYIRDCVSLNWRYNLTTKLQSNLSSNQLSHVRYGLETASTYDKVPNIDQRVTQDSSSACDTLAKLLEQVAILPFSIAFYAFYLAYSLNPAAPILCLAYFVLGYSLSYNLSNRLVSLVYKQGQLEGDFRLLHTHIMNNYESISLHLDRCNPETLMAQQQLDRLTGNYQLLINRQFSLNISTEWFTYSGAIVSYLIVGLSLLWWTSSSDISQEERLVLWSRGSYVCISLLHGFSQVVDALGLFSLVKGYAQRITDLLPIETDAQETSLWHCWKSNIIRVSYKPLNQTESADSSLEEGLLLMPSCRVEDDSKTRNQNHAKTISIAQEEGEIVPSIALTGFDVNYNIKSKLRSNGLYLVRGLNMKICAGDRWLVSGPNGGGKSTFLKLLTKHLLREGYITQRVVCWSCSQDPYLLPKTSLWDNLWYGNNASRSLALAELSLKLCGLEKYSQYLVDRSDRDEAEDARGCFVCEELSPGERQCLVVARILLYLSCGLVPVSSLFVLILDEATSALEESMEERLYSVLVNKLPASSAIISVGHRASLHQYHTKRLYLRGDESYSVS